MENPSGLWIISTDTTGPKEVLYRDFRVPLRDVDPTSVVPVNEDWFLISSASSTNAILFDSENLRVLASADLQIKNARMAKDPASGRIYAFGQDTLSDGAMPTAASAFINVTGDGKISVRRERLSNSWMGRAWLTRKVFASEKAARVVAVGLNGSIGYLTSLTLPALHQGLEYQGTYGESGTISSDGRYLFIASSGIAPPCNGTRGMGITEIDLEGRLFPEQCLAGLQAKGPNAYAFDLYTDVTSGLTFGYFNDLVNSQPTNFRISVFKNGREPDLAGRENNLVGAARASCAAVQLIGAPQAQACSAFAKPTATPAAR